MAKPKTSTVNKRGMVMDNDGYTRPDSPFGWRDITFGGATMPGCDPMGRPMFPGARPYIDPHAVVSQERRGTERIIKSDKLPTDLGSSRPTFERWGFKFLGPVDGDPLYQHVELPAGWTRKHDIAQRETALGGDKNPAFLFESVVRVVELTPDEQDVLRRALAARLDEIKADRSQKTEWRKVHDALIAERGHIRSAREQFAKLECDLTDTAKHKWGCRIAAHVKKVEAAIARARDLARAEHERAMIDAPTNARSPMALCICGHPTVMGAGDRCRALREAMHTIDLTQGESGG